MKNRFISNQQNNYYLNSYIFNDTNKDIIAEYSTTFNSPLLNDSGEYYLTIVRFEVPNTLPIFEFEDNKYYITLSYQGNDYSVPLVMQSLDAIKPNSIFTFQQFIDIINSGFQTAFTNLKAVHGGAPQTEAPYMIFDHDGDIFSLFTQQSYDPAVSGANTIEIFFNYELYNFFYNSFKVQNLGVDLPSNKDYRFIISDEKNNIPTSPVNYYEFKQQITTLYQWYDFQSIIFTSSSLPISAEYITTKRSDGRSIYQPFITDFVPELGKDRSAFVYNANPYRLIDMNGHGEIYNFDFRVSYLTKGGIIKPLTLPPNFNMSIKFGFIRKEFYQNNYI